MSEDKSQFTPSRRDVLKAGAVAALATGAAELGTKEISIIKEGVKTPHAVFYPLYERHDQGINPEDIPAFIDGYFREAAMTADDFQLSPEELAFGVFPVNGEQILQKLANLKSKLIVGDISFDQFDAMVKNFTSSENIDQIIGVNAAAIGTAISQLSKENQSHLTRRNFLKFGAFTLAAWGLTESIIELVRNVAGDDARQKTAMSRILQRLYGLVSDTHPEDNILFFRNLVMADKMLFVSELFYKQNNQIARIAYNLGSDHTGIEDFLRAGPDFCRSLLSLYSPQFLGKVVDTVGGLDHLCSVTLIDVAQLTYFQQLNEIPQEEINLSGAPKLEPTLTPVPYPTPNSSAISTQPSIPESTHTAVTSQFATPTNTPTPFSEHGMPHYNTPIETQTAHPTIQIPTNTPAATHTPQSGHDMSNYSTPTDTPEPQSTAQTRPMNTPIVTETPVRPLHTPLSTPTKTDHQRTYQPSPDSSQQSKDMLSSPGVQKIVDQKLLAVLQAKVKG